LGGRFIGATSQEARVGGRGESRDYSPGLGVGTGGYGGDRGGSQGATTGSGATDDLILLAVATEAGGDGG